MQRLYVTDDIPLSTMPTPITGQTFTPLTAGAIIESDLEAQRFRQLLLTLRQARLIELAAIEEYLGLPRSVARRER